MFRCSLLGVAACFCLSLCCTATAQTIPSGVVASAGGVDVIFTPDGLYWGGKLIGGTISLNSPDGTTIVGIENLLFEKLHHVGNPEGRQNIRWPTTSAQGHSVDEWRRHDSHVLLSEILDRDGNVSTSELPNSPFKRSGFFETGFYNIAAVDPTGLESRFIDAPRQLTYRGNLYHTDSFSLSTQDQGNYVDLARVVGIRGERSTFRLNVFGDGIESCIGGSGACFQFDLDWGNVAPNQAPIISFGSAEIPSVIEAGESLTLSADASDSDGTVELVEFFASEKLIPKCSFRTAPYECDWTPPPGDYQLTVRATDNLGESSGADPRQMTVVPIAARVRDGVLLSRGGVDVVFALDSEPLLDGALIGGTFSLQSARGNKMITFENLLFENLHHVGLETPFGVLPIPVVTDLQNPEHARYDSQVLITADMVGGSAGGHGFQEIGFENESARDPAGVESQIPPDEFGNLAVAYRGDIFDEGAFFVLPEFQSEFLDVAHLVGVPGETTLVQLDVLGFGIQNCGSGGQWGHAIHPYAVPIFDVVTGACLEFEIIWEIGPEETLPADFDFDGDLDGHDVDALVNEIVSGAGNGQFDLSGDGIVNGEDLLQWLADAATENGFAAPYSLGDANLDGSVSASDLNALGQNWLDHPNAWQLGDFTADGTVDASDLEELARNWLASIPPDGEQPMPVPESGSSVALIMFSLIPFLLRRRSQRAAIG